MVEREIPSGEVKQNVPIAQTQLAQLVQWIPAEIVRITSKYAAVSIDVRQFPQYLFNFRYLVGTVTNGTLTWQQYFTMSPPSLREKYKTRIYLLATGPGGKMLVELYKQGVKHVLIGDLKPAP